MCPSGWLHRLGGLCQTNYGSSETGASIDKGPIVTLPTAIPHSSYVVDLTHALGPEFPTYSGARELAFEPIATYDRDAKNVWRWLIQEHIGTHLDAPIHFSKDGRTADQIPIETLIAPLVVVDISRRAQDDPDTELTIDDLKSWESRYGTIIAGTCVAMNSGWERFASSPMYRNADSAEVMHFPGIHVEAAQLLYERGVVGLGVDTLSIDQGKSSKFPTHYSWLPKDRWAVEGLANLGSVPSTGATIVVGGPKLKGATGGLSRIIALF